MKIAFDHQIFSLQRYGGISRYITELASYLMLVNGNKISIDTSVHINALFNEMIGRNKEISTSLYYPDAPKYLIWALNEALAQIRKNKNNCDIFHETYYTSLDHGPSPAKRILTVHDLIYFKFPQFFSNSNRVQAKMTKSIMRANALICVSESTKLDLLSLFKVPEDKIYVAHHGKTFTNSGVHSQVDLSDPYLLFVGVRQNYKNFECLLKAYARSKKIKMNFKLVCFGGGPLVRNELKLLIDLGLNNDQLVMVSGDDLLLRKFYQGASVFIYPSKYEGFGMPLLEAMECNVPVICSNISAFKEVAGNAAEYFDPESDGDLMEKIEFVLFNSNRSGMLRNFGVNQAKLFSWEQCGIATMRAYEGK